MTYSEGSYTLTYPNLENNIYWQRRREICYYANHDNLSIEVATKAWAGFTA